MADKKEKPTLEQDKEEIKEKNISKVEFPDFDKARMVRGDNSIDLLKDIPLKVIVELGQTVLKIKDIMELGVGSIVELDKLSGDPVDILVNSRLIAKGEVVVIDEDFGVRITDLVLDKKIGKNNGEEDAGQET